MRDFIEESNRIEGIEGVSARDIQAHEIFLSEPVITLEALVKFVDLIQPGAVLRNRVGFNVRVGNHIAPPGGPNIEDHLRTLLTRNDLSAWERHTRYLNLHPFTDGNGRSARALWLWERHGYCPLGFLHTFYYETLQHQDRTLTT